MKPRNTAKMAICLALLIAVCVFVSPVSAKYSVTAEPLGGEAHILPGKVTDFETDVSVDGNAVQRITVDLGSGTRVDYTLWYGNGASVSGWMIYSNNGFYSQHTEVAINGVSSGYDYVGLQEIGKIDIIGYGRNETGTDTYDTGFIVYDTTFGLTDLQRGVVFYPITSIQDNVIYKFQIHSTEPVNIFWYTNTRTNVGKAVGTSLVESVNQWLSLGYQVISFIYDTVVSSFYWLKFFFIDNLVMTVALYLTVTMAFAARASKGNIAKFLRTWFKDQVGLIKFILEMWKFLAEMIGTVRGWFRL